MLLERLLYRRVEMVLDVLTENHRKLLEAGDTDGILFTIGRDSFCLTHRDSIYFLEEVSLVDDSTYYHDTFKRFFSWKDAVDYTSELRSAFIESLR